MSDRDIVGVRWCPWRPDWFEKVYDDGEVERTPGSHADACKLARTTGMVIVPASDGIVRFDLNGAASPSTRAVAG